MDYLYLTLRNYCLLLTNVSNSERRVIFFNSAFWVLFIFALVNSNQLLAGEIYRWVDKNGKVHYSDKKQVNTSEEFNYQDKYAIPTIVQQNAIKYEKNNPSRLVSLTSVSLSLPNSNTSEVRIGRVTCGAPIDLFWTKGFIDLTSEKGALPITKTFNRYGYTIDAAMDGLPNAGALSLEANIKDLKMNFCPASASQNYPRVRTRYRQQSQPVSAHRNTRSKNDSYIEIEWVLKEPVGNKELARVVTKGSHHVNNGMFEANGSVKSFNRAMVMNVTNLLSDKQFVSHLAPVSFSRTQRRFSKFLPVEIKIGKSDSKFNERVKFLKQHSITIKTQKGHGSGVIIDSAGHALTNAHVVGSAKRFDVIVDGVSFRANLVRLDEVRDVALIKIEGMNSRIVGVELAKDEPELSDELYVIGTPLSLSFQHTITKGIISASRNIRGMDYFQTDAAINPGNSGGPVFNSKGELIALSVSGIFTNNGASLNINYLIPIRDALSSLKISY